ncbi:MAG: hypothetical protein WD834_07155 [Actinomycetota bacterium]
MSPSTATGLDISEKLSGLTTPRPSFNRRRTYPASSSAVAQIVPSAVPLSIHGDGARLWAGCQGRSSNVAP